MHQELIEALYEIYLKQHYIEEDTIFDAFLDADLSLENIDKICETLLLKGVIIKSGANEQQEQEEFYDRSKLDYNEVYNEIILIDPSMELFVNTIKAIQPPQQNEWRNIIRQAKNGNSYARDRLIQMYLRIALNQALRFHKKYKYPLDEAIQEACAGIIEAYEKYDVSNSDDFSQYIALYIRNTLQRECSPISPLIYTPAYAKESLYQVQNIKNLHRCEECIKNEICPNLVDEISKCYDFKKPQIFTYLMLLQPVLHYDRQTNLQEYNLYNEDLIEIVYKNQITNLVSKALSKLNEKEREVLQLRFGIGNDSIKTLEEVGDIFGVTRERIRQIESKAIRKLKQFSSLKYFDF